MVKSILGYELRGGQSLKIKVCRKHFDQINECLGILDHAISDLAKPYHKFIGVATTVPGITEKSATYIIAEIGVDMAVFKSSKRLCSWAGLTPQNNNESAGKKKSVYISRAGVYLKPLMVQCAHAAVKEKKSPYFKYKYDRIKKRRGHKRAVIAIARMMQTCLFHVFSKQEALQ